MAVQQIAITNTLQAIVSTGSHVFMKLVDELGDIVYAPNEQAIRNLRAACDAALGEGEEK